jgi:hypothetical protein
LSLFQSHHDLEVKVKKTALWGLCAAMIAAPLATSQAPNSQSSFSGDQPTGSEDTRSSSYVPVDSWIYPALVRLQALGYLDTAYLGIRPWTRLSIVHMLDLSADDIATDENNDEARALFAVLEREFRPDLERNSPYLRPSAELESAYASARGITGTPLRDSYHLGQTLTDDYGRPYAEGFNSYLGLSGHSEAQRLSFYLRWEFQHAPSTAGYSQELASYLSDNLDLIPFADNPTQDTIPAGPIPAANEARIVETSLNYHVMGHEFSIGKNDHWLGPDQGASMLWSNNAEDTYDFQIDRVEPLYIPLLSRVTGPFRYDFLVGSLKGHTTPNQPWVHMEKINFKPTRNVEFGFDRLVIWGGEGHAPVTLHTFLHSFFSFQNVSAAEKNSRGDPGARFGTFDFSYRLPYLRRWVTLYNDSLVHDDVSPISAPRRAGWHPGVYVARFPKFEHLDLRLEGGYTDTVSASVQSGQFLYWEAIQKQGPTNKGFLVGDWVGRQGKGGQSWLTYHLSPQEEIQFMYRRTKVASGFIPGGTTQDDFALEARKRLLHDFEIRGFLQIEQWKAPIYEAGPHRNTTAEARVTWYPKAK